MAYSKDLRVRLIRSVEKGQSARSQAKVFDVSASTAVKWMQVFRTEGRPQAKPHAGGRRSALAPHSDWLKAKVEQQPDITLKGTLHRAFHARRRSQQKRRVAVFAPYGVQF